MENKTKSSLKEFVRYAFVGGIATVVDWGMLYLFAEHLFASLPYGIYLAHVVSFLAGLTTNFFLSNWLVFTAAHQLDRGRDWKSFLLFGAIGIIGLLMTEFGAWISDVWFGAQTPLLRLFGLDIRVYMVTKVIFTVIVFLWNYLARKILVYDRKRGSNG